MNLSALLLVTLVSCESADWSYHVGANYGTGTHEIGRPISNFDSDLTTVGVGLTYSPGVGRRHTELLEATRRVEFATVTGRAMTLPRQDDDGEVVGEEAVPEEFTEIFTEKPETIEDAWIYLIWAGAVAIVALTFGALHKMGVPIPFIPKKVKE